MERQLALVRSARVSAKSVGQNMVNFKIVKDSEYYFQKAASVKYDGAAYWKYIRTLREKGDIRTYNIAKEYIINPNLRKRLIGIHVLCQLKNQIRRNSSSIYLNAKKSINLIRSVLHDKRREVQIVAIFGLGHLSDKKIAGYIEKHVYSKSKELRFACAFALGGLEDHKSISMLIALSSDSDKEVRDWATFGLGDLGEADNRNIRDALLARLTDRDIDVRNEGLIGLAKRKDQRVIPYLLQELNGTDPIVATLEAAEYFADPILLPALNRWQMHIKKEGKEKTFWGKMLRNAINSCKRKKVLRTKY